MAWIASDFPQFKIKSFPVFSTGQHGDGDTRWDEAQPLFGHQTSQCGFLVWVSGPIVFYSSQSLTELPNAGLRCHCLVGLPPFMDERQSGLQFQSSIRCCGTTDLWVLSVVLQNIVFISFIQTHFALFAHFVWGTSVCSTGEMYWLHASQSPPL